MSSRSRIVLCGRAVGLTEGWADGQTDITKLIVAFSNPHERNFPSTHNVCIRGSGGVSRQCRHMIMCEQLHYMAALVPRKESLASIGPMTVLAV